MPSLPADLAPLLLTPEDAERVDVHGRTDAAVLVPLFEREGDLLGVFTRRRDDLRRHAGEISFPGGRRDPGESLRETALREAEEEIGLDPGGVTLAGALPPTPTVVTSYAVYPFVGVIEDGNRWRPSAGEVAEVLELPLRALRDGHGRRRLVRRGVPFHTDVYVVGEDLIWGATARILGELLARVGPVLERPAA
ncbi:MAG TPA: CoA pyrophosphatase [Solirubrobacteraceae bacterium]|nr:CoA pyrophosphatase [Solirubrobacteraceae bacterium]